METKRSPGLILTGLGIVLALLSVFAPDAPFAPSNLFIPVMMIFFGRALSRGARMAKRRPTVTAKLPPNVFYPPAPEPRRPAKSSPSRAPAPLEVAVPEPSPPPARSEPFDFEEMLSEPPAEDPRPAPAPKPSMERLKPQAKPPTPVVVPPAVSHEPVYPKATPSSARARSSKEMVEEAKKRLKRD